MRQASSRILFALAVAAIPLSASADNAFTLRDVEVVVSIYSVDTRHAASR